MFSAGGCAPRTKAHEIAPLEVREVTVGDHRYVVCRNEEGTRKDAHDREAIVAALRTALTQGDNALVGNHRNRHRLRRPGVSLPQITGCQCL
jgi:hypothetical protein